MAVVLRNEDLRAQNYARLSRFCAWMLYGLAAVWGMGQDVSAENGLVYLLGTFSFALLITLWARYDLMSRGGSMLHVHELLYFLLWPVGAVVYLFFRSGWRGLLTAAFHAWGLLAVGWLFAFATRIGLHAAGVLDESYYE